MFQSRCLLKGMDRASEITIFPCPLKKDLLSKKVSWTYSSPHCFYYRNYVILINCFKFETFDILIIDLHQTYGPCFLLGSQLVGGQAVCWSLNSQSLILSTPSPFSYNQIKIIISIRLNYSFSFCDSKNSSFPYFH